ncbi:MAG: right-handed parallel beta-helix repeat-containing protein [Blastocatellia bacterium]|nr:right-handed parallel beta-helix repeat-containing protein [Blastocatellia bacterium]
MIRNNKIGTNVDGLRRLRIFAYGGPNFLPAPSIQIVSGASDNRVENNVIAGTRGTGVGRLNYFGDEAPSFNIIRNNRIGVGANGENIAPPGDAANPQGPNDEGSYSIGILANYGDTITGNIIGNFPLAGIKARDLGATIPAGTPPTTIQNNTIFNSAFGIEVGQLRGAVITNNTISDCTRGGVVVANALLDASHLYGVPAINPEAGGPTLEVTVSSNTFTNLGGPRIALTPSVNRMLKGEYVPNTARTLQSEGPNLYQPTPLVTAARKNADGTVTVTGETVGGGMLELYGNGRMIQAVMVAGGGFSVTLPASTVQGLTTVSALVTVSRQTSELSAPTEIKSDNPPPPDTVPPTVSVTAPMAGQQIESKAGTQLSIVWQSSDNVGVVRHDVWLARPGPGAVDSIASGLAGTAQSFTWNVPENLEVPQAQIVVMAFDAAGNQGQGASGMFTVKKPNTPPPDTEKPVVSNVTLSAKKVKRKLDPTLTITWKSTDNIGVVSHDLIFADATPVVSGLPGNAQTFTWTVPASIPKKTVGTVKVTARDAAGNLGSGESLSVTIK